MKPRHRESLTDALLFTSILIAEEGSVRFSVATAELAIAIKRLPVELAQSSCDTRQLIELLAMGVEGQILPQAETVALMNADWKLKELV